MPSIDWLSSLCLALNQFIFDGVLANLEFVCDLRAEQAPPDAALHIDLATGQRIGHRANARDLAHFRATGRILPERVSHGIERTLLADRLVQETERAGLQGRPRPTGR